MKATGLNSLIARIDAAEYGMCCRLNRGAHRPIPRRVFQFLSKNQASTLSYFSMPVDRVIEIGMQLEL